MKKKNYWCLSLWDERKRIVITLGPQEKKATEEEHRTRAGSLALRSLSNNRYRLYSGWSLSHTSQVNAYLWICTLISPQMEAQKTFCLHQLCFQLHPLECHGLPTASNPRKKNFNKKETQVNQGLEDEENLRLYIRTWKKPNFSQAFLRELIACDLLEPCNFEKSIMGSFRLGMLALEFPFPELGRSGIGHTYLVGTFVIPLSHKCFTPFWNSLSVDSFSPLVSTAKLVSADMADRRYCL